MVLRWSEEEYLAHCKRYGSPQLAGVSETSQKVSKYRNKKVTVGDNTFDSLAEARRWQELVILHDAGAISGLQRQVKYEIKVNGRHICFYVADFVYNENGKAVVEDVKGVRTPVYQLKKKLLRATLGIAIKEVGAKKRTPH